MWAFDFNFCPQGVSERLLRMMFASALTCLYLVHPLLYNTMKSDSTFSNSNNSLHTRPLHILGEYNWADCAKTPAIWLPIKSQSIKPSVKLTDAMTCRDCSLYTRSEEYGPHQFLHSMDSAVCGSHPFKQEKALYMAKTTMKMKKRDNLKCFVPVSFYINTKYIFCFGSGGWSCFVDSFHLLLCGHFLASLVMFGWLHIHSNPFLQNTHTHTLQTYIKTVLLQSPRALNLTQLNVLTIVLLWQMAFCRAV